MIRELRRDPKDSPRRPRRLPLSHPAITRPQYQLLGSIRYSGYHQSSDGRDPFRNDQRPRCFTERCLEQGPPRDYGDVACRREPAAELYRCTSHELQEVTPADSQNSGIDNSYLFDIRSGVVLATDNRHRNDATLEQVTEYLSRFLQFRDLYK